MAAAAQAGPEENKWHEHVLRYTTGASVPAAELQVVLVAGSIPPPGGGGADQVRAARACTPFGREASTHRTAST